MNWNSAIISWLKAGWPPPPRLLVTCMPSRFVWYSRTSPPLRSGSGEVALVEDVRLPGASSASAIQLRPFTGSSCTCCGSTLPPSADVATLSSGASAVTVTVSCTVDGPICRLIVAVWPTSSCRPVRVWVAKPWSSRGDGVDADAHRDPVDTGFIGHGFEAVAGGFQHRDHRDAGQHAAR